MYKLTQADEAIIEETRKKLVAQFMDAVGKFQAMRMAGLFFNSKFEDDESVAMYLAKRLLNRERAE